MYTSKNYKYIKETEKKLNSNGQLTKFEDDSNCTAESYTCSSMKNVLCINVCNIYKYINTEVVTQLNVIVHIFKYLSNQNKY